MPSGGVHSITEIRALLRRLLRAIRANWPATEILLRADSHYCGPEVLDWCRAIYSAAYPALSGLVQFLMRDCCQGRPEVCAPAVAALATCCPETETAYG